LITPYIPARGDLVWINFDPVAGHEQAGYRPAVVVTPRDYNAHTRLAVVCPITRRVKHYRFEVPLSEGLAVTGVVLSDHVRSVDWKSRDATLIGIVPHGIEEL
jgi:mRNA interferase MazF